MSWRASATLVLIAWGALAFGAVYPWAFIPLFAACAAAGLAMLLQRNGTRKIEIVLSASLALLVIAIALQLVPLPVAIIRWISPETDLFLQRYAVGYATTFQRHALSIQPRSTVLALAAAFALAALFLGQARALTARDALHVAGGVAVLGAVLALDGVVQKAMWNGRLYGFWTPIQSGESFGPFVNRNHFAGWMLMALPLAIGCFYTRLARGLSQGKREWRDVILWLSSADASKTILAGFAAVLMALGLMLTMSRSGIVGLLVSLTLSAWFVVRRQATRSRKTIAAGFLILVAVAALWSTGVDRLVLRFSERGPTGMGGRLGIWTDAWRIAGRFPLAGTGLNTFGAATVFYQTSNPQLHFAEAHNDYLQLLAEGGALVGIPAGVVIVALVWIVRRRFCDLSIDRADYWIRIGAVTGILAVACQEAVDFSLQIPGNATLFVVLLGLAVRRTNHNEPAAGS